MLELNYINNAFTRTAPTHNGIIMRNVYHAVSHVKLSPYGFRSLKVSLNCCCCAALNIVYSVSSHKITRLFRYHCSDVVITIMTYQITGNSTVYPIVFLDNLQENMKSCVAGPL